MVYIPNTTVSLLSGVPLDSTYSDVLWFDSVGAQTAYFSGKVKKTYTNFSYQRVTSAASARRPAYTIRVEDYANNLYDVNYIMFDNNAAAGKWFYAFVTQINFINANVTEIVYEIDDFQTWLFEMSVGKCYVEREHLDFEGTEPLCVNLQPEPVDLGPMKESGSGYVSYPVPLNYIIVASSTDPTGKITDGQLYNGFYSGLTLREFNLSPGSVNSYLAEFADQGFLQNVISIQLSYTGISDADTTAWNPSGLSITPYTSIDGYLPKNKKLLSSPYIYYILSTMSGQNPIQLEPQLFEDAEGSTSISPQFEIAKYGGLNSAVNAQPTNYQSGKTWNYMCELPPVPQSPWAGDSYTNWLSQNLLINNLESLSRLISPIGAAAGIGGDEPGNGGVLTGTLGNAADALIDVFRFNREKQVNSATPHLTQVSNLFPYYKNHTGFQCYVMTITNEYARMIDDFFEMFGYATNRLKVPNLDTRESWNYVKTKDCVISGNMPVDSMNTIKRVFNRGVRLWHNPDIGNYSLINGPVKSRIGGNVNGT